MRKQNKLEVLAELLGINIKPPFRAGAVTLALILTIGNGIIYMIAHFAQQIANYAVFHYPVILICAIAVVIMGICMIVPTVVYHMLSKESVTQRLRNCS